jgi:hypothetical protein
LLLLRLLLVHLGLLIFLLRQIITYWIVGMEEAIAHLLHLLPHL